MLDAAALEKRGVHTVTIVWDTFVRAAKTTARLQGVPDVKLVVVPSRSGSDGPDRQRAKAAAAVPEIVKGLLAT